MNKTIIAMGGGYSGEKWGTFHLEKLPEGDEFYENSTKVIDQLIIESAQAENPNVLLITTASEDGKHNVPQYTEALEKQFLGFGAKKVEALNILTDEPSFEEIKAKIEEADVVYGTGGNTDQMVRVWQELGVDELLVSARERGVVMSGLSAGASCWFKYVCTNSKYTNEPYEMKGLGWVDATICPHYDSEPFGQEALKKMLRERPGEVGLAIEEYAALEIVNDTYRVHSQWSGGRVLKCYWKNGEYFVEEVEISNDFKPLDEITKI